MAVIILPGLARSWAINPDVLSDWRQQYDQQAKRMGNRTPVPVKQVYDRNALTWNTDKTPLDVQIRRTEALIENLNSLPGAPDLAELTKKLNEIKRTAADLPRDKAIDTYMALRKITRTAALSNPLLDFDDIVFVARGVRNDVAKSKREYDGDHFCDQYYGHNGRPEGNLYILRNFKSDNPELIDVVKGLTVPGGTNAGMEMSKGAFVSPDLSWDGKTIAFAWSSGGAEKWRPENRFGIFRVNIDGTNLVRLTDGDFDDFDPCWLPGGRIVFISTRRGGYGRCHGRPVPSYTMHSMEPDGSDLICIDFHETNEFHPSVDNNGMLIYTRWDYLDRDHSAAHHIWTSFPDGRNPRSFHANYALPWSTIEKGNWPNGLNQRPWAEFNCRAIPGSHKYIATAGPHHGQAFGSLVMIDTHIADDSRMSQVKRITPYVRFPESEAGTRNWSDMAYGTAWPLSEDFYLCNHKDGIVLLDSAGNREMICKLANRLRPIDPIPLRPRPMPLVIDPKTYQGQRRSQSTAAATISIMNVYLTDDYGKLPDGAKIKSLRIIQVIPKTTPNSDKPKIGFGSQSIARLPLGVVPVEEDGSVYFKAPINKSVYFQLLDENGMAVQSMRSLTYVHAGEQMNCVGCHENKLETPAITARPLAMQRPPSVIQPEVADQYPFGFHRHVRPIFEQKCVSCHIEKKVQPQRMNYRDLEPYAFYFGHGYRNALHGGLRTTPGKFGASYSKMGKALLNDTHRQALKDKKFTTDDFRKIVIWLDLNSNEFNACKEIDRQRKGEVVWPKLDVDPANPVGDEKNEIALK